VTIVLAVLSGALCAASFPKFGAPAFAWVALAPLMVAAALAARTRRPLLRRPFFLGFIAGLVYFGFTLYWLAITMGTYGDMPYWLSSILAGLLASYLALYPALFASLVALAVRRLGVGGVWLAPIFWVATEWLRGTIGPAFPWVPLGASQATVIPIVQMASVTGGYGLSALLALVSSGAAAVSLSRRRVQWVAFGGVVGLVIAIALAGAFRVSSGRLTSTGEVLRVGLLQGNVEQDVKWNQAYREPILRRYLDLSRQVVGAGANLVIWPEASMPFFFESEAPAAEPVRRLAAESRTPFIIGTDEIEGSVDGARPRVFNSAVLVGPDGKTRDRYRKIQLVPFGEYVPFKKLLFFVSRLVQSVSDFTPGTDPVVFDVNGARVSVAICYESIYPSLSRAFVANGSELLAVITNDAWFARSSAAYQHFEMGGLRAVEQGRFLVRAANTGISGAVDPYGRTMLTTRLFEPAAVTVDVRLLTGRTIYSRVGDVLVWFSLVATAGFLLVARREIVRSHV
jgi:apolipoprotein N-acyltransferase